MLHVAFNAAIRSRSFSEFAVESFNRSRFLQFVGPYAQDIFQIGCVGLTTQRTNVFGDPNSQERFEVFGHISHSFGDEPCECGRSTERKGAAAMVKGGSPRHRLWAEGLGVGDHDFLALVYARNLTCGNYSACSAYGDDLMFFGRFPSDAPNCPACFPQLRAIAGHFDRHVNMRNYICPTRVGLYGIKVRVFSQRQRM